MVGLTITTFYKDLRRNLILGDAVESLESLDDESVNCFVTSPPYWNQREYGHPDEFGHEKTVVKYVYNLMDVFDEAQRVLTKDGTCFVNLGDKYYTEGKNRKSAAQAPARFAIAMEDAGWLLRNEIIWWKPVCIPSGSGRFTVDYEKIYFFTKNEDHYFKTLYEPVSDATLEMIKSGRENAPSKSINYGGLSHTNQNKWYNKMKEIYDRGETPMRIMRAVWNFPYKPCSFDHTAVFPPELPARCIDCGCPEDGVVGDMFMGTGTTAEVCELLKRRWVGSDIVPKNCETIMDRLRPYIQQRTLDVFGGDQPVS